MPAKKHGESFSCERTAEYVSWMNTIARCERPEHSRYAGRGIVVCERWRASFEAFLSDIGRRPSDVHSLDRIDTNGNYEPGNVRWATETQQQRNRSNNRMIAVGSEVMCLSEWAERTGIKRETLARRIRTGMDPARAIDPAPVFPALMFRGAKRSAREIAKMVGIPENSLLRRLRRHGDMETAISEWSKNNQGKKGGKTQ